MLLLNPVADEIPGERVSRAVFKTLFSPLPISLPGCFKGLVGSIFRLGYIGFIALNFGIAMPEKKGSE